MEIPFLLLLPLVASLTLIDDRHDIFSDYSSDDGYVAYADFYPQTIQEDKVEYQPYYILYEKYRNREHEIPTTVKPYSPPRTELFEQPTAAEAGLTDLEMVQRFALSMYKEQVAALKMKYEMLESKYKKMKNENNELFEHRSKFAATMKEAIARIFAQTATLFEAVHDFVENPERLPEIVAEITQDQTSEAPDGSDEPSTEKPSENNEVTSSSTSSSGLVISDHSDEDERTRIPLNSEENDGNKKPNKPTTTTSTTRTTTTSRPTSPTSTTTKTTTTAASTTTTTPTPTPTTTTTQPKIVETPSPEPTTEDSSSTLPPSTTDNETESTVEATTTDHVEQNGKGDVEPDQKSHEASSGEDAN